jgi:hypothetical protein
MERNIVLAHELIQLDVLGVLPPFLPLLGVSGCNRRVANRSIKPDVKDLALPAFERDRSTPRQVASDATRLETFLEPRLCDDPSVRGPITLFRGLFKPLLAALLQLAEVQEQVS